MNRNVRFAVMFAAALAFVLANSGGAEAKKIDKKFHEKFNVTEGARLLLYHGDGDVIISAWDRDEVEIKVRYVTTAGIVGIGGNVDFDVEFSQEGRDIVVRGKETSTGGVVIRSGMDSEYKYTIQAPSWVALQLDGDDGDVKVSDWRERIECTLDDGDVVLKNIEAPSVELQLEDGDVDIVRLSARLDVSLDDGDVVLKDCVMKRCAIDLEDGNVEMNDCEGDFKISVDDGDVEMRRVKAGEIKVDGEDGHISIGLVRSDNLMLDIATDDGNVIVEVESGVSAEFAIRTDDGSVRVDLSGVRGLQKEEHTVSGTIGDGEGRIRIRTADGGVVLRDDA